MQKGQISVFWPVFQKGGISKLHSEILEENSMLQFNTDTEWFFWNSIQFYRFLSSIGANIFWSDPLSSFSSMFPQNELLQRFEVQRQKYFKQDVKVYHFFKNHHLYAKTL